MKLWMLCLVLCAILLASIATIVVSARYVKETNQYTITDEGVIFKPGKVDGALLNYLQRGPQPGNSTWERWALVSDGYKTASYHLLSSQLKVTPPPIPKLDLSAIQSLGSSILSFFGSFFSSVFSFDWLIGGASAANRYLVSSNAACTITAIATDTDCWSATSGGAGGASIPVAGDAVIVDASSGANEVKQNGAMSFDSLTFTNSPLTGLGWNTNSSNLTISGACTTSAGTGVTVTIFISTMSVGGNFNRCVQGSLTAVLNLTGTGIWGATDAGGGLIDGTINVTGGTRTMGDSMQAKQIILTATLDTGSKNLFITGGTGTSKLQIGASGVLTANASAITLGTGGDGADWDSSNATSTFTQGTSTVDFTGTGSITMLAADNDFNLLTISGGTVTLASAVDVGSTLTISGGTLAKGTFALTAAALTMSGGDLTSTSGTVTVSGAVNISSASSAIDFGSETWTVTGTWTNASTDGAVWEKGTGTVTFNASGATTVTFAGSNLAEDEFNNVTFNDSAAMTYTMATRGLRLGGALTVTDTTTTVSLVTSSLAVTAGSVVIGTNGTVTAGSSTITVSGNWTSSAGTFTAGTSTIVFSATASFTPATNQSFFNITVGDGFTVTKSGTTIFVTGLLRIGVTTGSSTWNNGTPGVTYLLDQVTVPIIAASGYTIAGLGGFSFRADGATTMLVPALNYGAAVLVFFSNTNLAKTHTLQGNVTTTASCTVSTNGTVSSTLIVGTNTLACGSLLLGNTNVGNLTVTSGTVTITGNVSIGSAGAASYIDFGSSTWTVGGIWTNNSTTASWNAGTSSVTFTAAAGGTMTFAGTNLAEDEFNNVTFTSSAGTAQTFTMATRGLRLGGTLTISDGTSTTALTTSGSNLAITTGSVTVGAGGILTANASTITVGNDFTLAGTFIAGGSTITVAGNFTKSGGFATFTPGTSTVVMTGVGKNLALDGTGTLYNLIITGSITDTAENVSNQTTISGSLSTGCIGSYSDLSVTGTGNIATTGCTSNFRNVSFSSTTTYAVLNGTAWLVSGLWTNSTTSASWDAGTGTVAFTSATGGMMTFAGANLTEAEFNNVTFDSSSAGEQGFTMATRGLSWSGTLTITGDTVLTKATFTLGTEASGALTVGGAGSNRLVSWSGAVAVTTVLVVGGENYIEFGSETWTVSGTWTNHSTSGFWSVGTSSVMFTSATGGTMTFAGTNLPVDEFNNVTFTSSAGTAQTFTMATRGLRLGGALTISDEISTTTLDKTGFNIVFNSLTITSTGIIADGTVSATNFTIVNSGAGLTTITSFIAWTANTKYAWNDTIASGIDTFTIANVTKSTFNVLKNGSVFLTGVSVISSTITFTMTSGDPDVEVNLVLTDGEYFSQLTISLPYANFVYEKRGLAFQFYEQAFFKNDPRRVIISWYWDFGDGHTSDEPNPYHVYSSWGYHQVSLTVVGDYMYSNKFQLTVYADSFEIVGPAAALLVFVGVVIIARMGRRRLR